MLLLTLVAVLALGGLAKAEPIFDFTVLPGTSAEAVDGFKDAAARWSALFSDDVTINLTIGFTSLGATTLAQASSSQDDYNYADVRTALVDDATSADDALATSNLQTGSALSFWINRTSNNPNGSGDATPYLDDDGDANNTTIHMSNADAKALGLLAADATGEDAAITFNSDFSFDFDPSDGIAATSYDFVGIATHEIGHALGFISGVDILDINSPPVNGPFSDDQFTFFSTLDLYRYSTLGLDWTADTRGKFFSIDGGTVSLGTFATGDNFGDGDQASHWEDHLGLGLMDPTAALGELLSINTLDTRAMDVIGWDLAVPEPSTLALFGAAIGLVAWRRRRRQTTE